MKLKESNLAFSVDTKALNKLLKTHDLTVTKLMDFWNDVVEYVEVMHVTAPVAEMSESDEGSVEPTEETQDKE